MSTLTFDTMQYADDLISAGVPEAQAKAQVKILKTAIDETLNSELATKSDLKSEIKALELQQEKRFVRLEVLMSIMLVILVIPILKDLLT